MTKYLLLLILFAGFACKKDSSATVEDTPVVMGTGVPGTWELRNQINGWTGATKYPGGNGHIYVFTADHYQMYAAGALVKQGVYTIAKKTSVLQNKVMDAIVFDNDTSGISTFVDVSSTQLTLSFDAYDAGSVTYERIK